jgi:hypothetical protein
MDSFTHVDLGTSTQSSKEIWHGAALRILLVINCEDTVSSMALLGVRLFSLYGISFASQIIVQR